MEEWKPVPDYPNYEVSNFGNVRNIKLQRTMNINKTKKGYCFIVLSKNNKVLHKKVHRLVAELFIPNPENKPQVDHIDRDKSNNMVTNLRWVTNIENCLNRPKYIKSNI